ncbi:HAMP domain-containing sensor histidine kinase [Paenibacillus arenosi]|uniref:HAMP domain-containing sensor histidine kinase n=1 Tax=Paenibacillus arenosi TaxID=2774142 RepID=UPI001CDB9CF5|nr:HAMP domain-containing sensor histidine kinase [Paenibacillus arenosi]
MMKISFNRNKKNTLSEIQQPTKSRWWKFTDSRVRWRHSLLVKYLSLVITAMMLFFFLMPLATIILAIPMYWNDQLKEKDNPYANGHTLMTAWYADTKKLQASNEKAIEKHLADWKAKLPQASIFWVDEKGMTRKMLPEQKLLPKQWTAQDSISFMKKSFEGDPFTVVSFIGGENAKEGFVTIQIPRKLMTYDGQQPLYTSEYAFAIMMTLSLLFVLFSWRFFYRIQRRLKELERAMAMTDEQGIPITISVSKEDEIGQLQHSFNRMTSELRASRKREQEEEELRKQLIANLSHDIRTPLTTIRTHVHTIQQENDVLQERSKTSLRVIVQKCEDLAHLVDNLLSYTLLSAKRYTFQPQAVDVVRLARESAAAWYPMWEKHQFEVEVNLPSAPIVWNVDQMWMKRILDNVYQNVVRHAASGRYIRIEMNELPNGMSELVIQDKGPGMKVASSNKGAGIGLSIIEMMLKEMSLEQEVFSSSNGTSLVISPKRGNVKNQNI